MPKFLVQSVLNYSTTLKKLSMSSLDRVTRRMQQNCTASAHNVHCSAHIGDFGLQAIILAPFMNVKFTARKVLPKKYRILYPFQFSGNV